MRYAERRRVRLLLASVAFLLTCGFLGVELARGEGSGAPAGSDPPGIVTLRTNGSGMVQADAANGRRLYLTYCVVCHGATGKGDGPAAAMLDPKPRPLTDDRLMSTRSDAWLFRAVTKGGAGIPGASVHMGAWEEALSEKERWDLVAHLRVLHRPTQDRGNVETGRALYGTYCWNCHGREGKGNGPFVHLFVPPSRDFTSAERMARLSDQDLFNAISRGGVATLVSPYMPAWGGVFSDQQLWSLVRFLRLLQGGTEQPTAGQPAK
ncbi:MAG: c-type cytochrome [Candidatus Tectomicrobia bacterium]|nr:c-type cytochrome [Candidatus Tectomicrobia bacterium]